MKLGLVQRRVGVILLVIMVAVIFLMSVRAAYAPPPILTLNVSPNPAYVGQSVTFSGDGANSGDSIVIDALPGTSCLILPVIASGTAKPSGQYAIVVSTSTVGGVGAYSIFAYDQNTHVLSACVILSIDPVPIPEYPVGLSLLAVFMIVAYTLIRRRTLTRNVKDS